MVIPVSAISHGDILNNQVGKPVWRQMIEDAKNINWRENRSDAILMREPIGTVLSIMTFNGPIVLMGMKIVHRYCWLHGYSET